MICDVVFHPRWWSQNAGVSFDERFFADPDVRIDADCRMRRALHERFGELGLGAENPRPRPLLGSDLLACGYLASWMLGCEVIFSHDDAPQVRCANLDDAAAWALCAPDLQESAVWRRIQTQIDVLHARFGRVETHINLMGVLNVALDLRGQQLFMDFYEEPDLARHMLGVCAETLIRIGRRLRLYSDALSSGVTSVMAKVAPKVYLTSNCAVDMVSLPMYEAFLLEHDNAMADCFAPFGIHHCGKSMERVIGGYAKVRNLAFVEVGAGSDVAEVIRSLPDSVLVNLRVSPVALANESREELTRQIRAMRALAAPERLSISCVGIDGSVGDERIRWLFEAANA